MDISVINYLSVLVAAVGGFVFGAVYYGLVSKQWQAAGRIAPEQARPGATILIVTFVAELIMAFVLAGVIGGSMTSGVVPGMIVAFYVWLGFMVTTMAVNHRYQAYGWNLTLIDGVHWLGVALIMGAIIGWWS